MATNTAGTQARQLPWQVTHMIRRNVSYDTPNIGTADSVKVGVLPQGAFITGVRVEIVTAFNAGTTNVLTVGTNTGSDNNIVAAGDVNEAATGVTSVTRGLGRSLAASADKTVYVLYTQSGSAATAGEAEIVIEYVADNDQ